MKIQTNNLPDVFSLSKILSNVDMLEVVQKSLNQIYDQYFDSQEVPDSP